NDIREAPSLAGGHRIHRIVHETLEDAAPVVRPDWVRFKIVGRWLGNRIRGRVLAADGYVEHSIGGTGGLRAVGSIAGNAVDDTVAARVQVRDTSFIGKLRAL